MVGHEEARAKRPDHLHLVTDQQVAHEVGGHTPHRLTVVVFEHALDGERHVVVPWPLAVARAGNRILACMVRLAVGIQPRRDDADRLAFEHREGQAAEIEHDVVRIVVLLTLLQTHLGDAQVAGHAGGDGFVLCLGAIEVGEGVGSRPRGNGRAKLCRVEARRSGSADG